MEIKKSLKWLRQRELATDYSFSGSVAITYTFGSKFANLVNTRF